jgi:hypothetical protein
MKLLLVVLTLLLNLQVVSAQVEERMRQLFFQCNNPSGIQNYYNETLGLSSQNALHRGYKGSAMAMLAGTKSGVQEKFSVFSEGKKELEAAIAMDPSSYELRFLRYAVQSEVPMIVGYKGNVKEDIDYLLQGFENGTLSKQYWFWQNALKFIQTSDDRSEEQWRRLQKFVV